MVLPLRGGRWACEARDSRHPSTCWLSPIPRGRCPRPATGSRPPGTRPAGGTTPAQPSSGSRSKLPQRSEPARRPAEGWDSWAGQAPREASDPPYRASRRSLRVPLAPPACWRSTVASAARPRGVHRARGAAESRRPARGRARTAGKESSLGGRAPLPPHAAGKGNGRDERGDEQGDEEDRPQDLQCLGWAPGAHLRAGDRGAAHRIELFGAGLCIGREHGEEERQREAAWHDDGAEQLVARRPDGRGPKERHADEPPEHRKDDAADEEEHERSDLEDARSPRPDAGTLPSVDRDVGGVAEAVEERAHAGLVGRTGSARLFDVLGNLLDDLAAASVRQIGEVLLEPFEVVADELLGHGH